MDIVDALKAVYLTESEVKSWVHHEEDSCAIASVLRTRSSLYAPTPLVLSAANDQPIMSHKTFYDPQNPRMLPPQEIAKLSSAECAAACDQIDQQIVNLLQDIDGEFTKSYRTVTEKMLPSLERYGEASRGSWEGVKFWKGFFEAAANVKLSEGYGASDTTSALPQESTVQDDSSDADTTLRGGRSTHGDRPAWSNDDSPFDKLQKDMRSKFGIESSVQSQDGAGGKSTASSTSASLRRPHLSDLSFDSPDSVRAPRLEMMSTESRPDPSSPLSEQSKTHSYDASLVSPDGKTPVARGDNAGGKLLRHQVLLKQMLGTERGGPVASTPLKPGGGKVPTELFPPEAGSAWDGIADLRTTGLADFQSPRKADTATKKTKHHHEKTKKGKAKDVSVDEDSVGPRSPPEMVHYSVSRSKLARTPAKEAARLVARDVLETARLKAGYANPMDLDDSPVIEPPSVVKNWATRGYDTYTGAGGEGARKGFEEEAFEDDDEEDQEAPAAASFRFDASVQEELSRVALDPDEEEGYSHLDEAGRPIPAGAAATQLVGDESDASGFPVVDHSFASRADESGFPEAHDGEEETLFGVGGQPVSRRRSQFGTVVEEEFDESLAGGEDDVHQQQGQGQDGKRFNIMAPEEIETLHGGVLLESQPFEASPLQGRDWRGL